MEGWQVILAPSDPKFKPKRCVGSRLVFMARKDGELSGATSSSVSRGQTRRDATRRDEMSELAEPDTA